MVEPEIIAILVKKSFKILISLITQVMTHLIEVLQIIEDLLLQIIQTKKVIPNIQEKI